MARKVKTKFETVVVGGTFDEFHKGHRVLLTKAFEIGKRVLIGLCTDEFVKKLRKYLLSEFLKNSPYQKRQL